MDVIGMGKEVSHRYAVVRPVVHVKCMRPAMACLEGGKLESPKPPSYTGLHKI